MYTDQALVPAPDQDAVVAVAGKQIGEKCGVDHTAALGLLHVACSNKISADECNKLVAMDKQDDLHSLFQEGVRAAGKRHAAKSLGGTLALAKRIVEALQGSLWVQLDHHTQSICFNITVPVLLPVDMRNEIFRTVGVGVLAIEDCPTQRKLLETYLKKLRVPHTVLGAQIEHFENICEHAKEFVQLNDGLRLIVILDQNLNENPLILGTDLAQQLKGAFAKADLITLIRSGNTLADDIELYMRHTDGIIEKTDSFPTLRSKLARLMMHNFD